MASTSSKPKSRPLVQKPAKIRKISKSASNQRKSSFEKAYNATACILKDVYEKKGHVKTLIYQNNYWDKRHLLYLVVNTLKNKQVIDTVIKKCKLRKLDNPLSLTEVIVFELLFGRGKVQPFSKSVQSIQKAKKTLIRALNNITSVNPELVKSQLLKTQEFLPKYARVNTLLTTISETILALRKERIGQVKYIREETTFKEYLSKVQNLRKNAFIIDYHFPDLFVFHPSQALYTTNVYKQGFIKISDKASYFPVKMLSPPPGCTAMDGFAAPGMKTCLMASLMNNKGKILASDWKIPRVEVMKKILGSSGVTCCEVQCQNFLEINPYEKPYSSVEYALIDPSCSSSGMVGRLSEFLGEKDDQEKIEALKKFQISALKHAMSFPNIKRIAYSTCSINVEENEQVVEAALTYFPEQYKVVDLFPEWPERGDNNFSFGSKCVRAFPKKHLTNGFFVAVLQRVEDVPLKIVLPNESQSKGKKRKKSLPIVEAEVSEEEDEKDSDDIKVDSDKEQDSDEEIKALEDLKSLEASDEAIKEFENSDEDIKSLEDLDSDDLNTSKLEDSASKQRIETSDSEASVSSKEIESMILSKKKFKMETPLECKFNSLNANEKKVLKLNKKKRRYGKFVVTEM